MPVRVRFQAFANKPPQMLTRHLITGAMALERKFARKIIGLLRKYPPQISTNYIRTNRLGASWDLDGPKVVDGAVVVDIINYVKDKRGRSYAPYVQGRWQVPIHEGRWLTIDDAGAQLGPEFYRQLRQLLIDSVKAPKT